MPPLYIPFSGGVDPLAKWGNDRFPLSDHPIDIAQYENKLIAATSTGAANVITSNDGGATWNKAVGLQAVTGYDYCAVTPTSYLVCRGPDIWRSTDGVNFSEINNPAGGSDVKRIRYDAYSDRLWVTTSVAPRMYYSDDDGLTWTQTGGGGTGVISNDATFLPGSYWEFLVGTTLYYSIDAGINHLNYGAIFAATSPGGLRTLKYIPELGKIFYGSADGEYYYYADENNKGVVTGNNDHPIADYYNIIGSGVGIYGIYWDSDESELIMIGGNGIVMTSPNGVDGWKERPSQITPVTVTDAYGGSIVKYGNRILATPACQVAGNIFSNLTEIS